MSKLDIAIKVTSGGAGEPFVVNGGEWTRHIIDVRHLLGNLKDIDKEHQVAHILKFTDDCCLLIVSRLISGRSGDNIAAWIHIPAIAEVSGSEVVRVMHLAESVILQSSVNMEPLSEFATNEYPNRKPYCRSPQGQSLAYRRYDEVNLPLLLGNNRYQDYYDRYQYIYLLDMESSVDIAEGVAADDITRHLVSPLSMVLPPDAEALRRHFRQDVSVMLSDGTPFDHPIAVKKGESFRIFFVRKGFKPIERIVTKIDNNAFSPIKLSDIRYFEWMKIINLSLFNFVDEQNQALPSDVHPTLKVNGKKLGATGMEFAERELRLVNVEASASTQGYEGITKFVDLSQPAPYVIRLSRRVHDRKNKVLMRNGKIADMTLVSKYIPDHKNGPFSGYVFDRAGNLVYDTYLVWAHRVQGLLVGLAFALLCWGVSTIVGTMKNKTVSKETVQTQTESDNPTMLYNSETSTSKKQALQDVVDQNDQDNSVSEDDPTIDNTTLADAITYLENNPNWKREDMENFSDLRGLFDDMNTFNFDNILNIWKPQLKNSKKFMEVAGYAQQIKKQSKNPATGEHSPNYCQGSDITINRQNYIDHLFYTIYPEKRRNNVAGNSTNNNSDKTTAGKAGNTKTNGQNVSNKANDTQLGSTDKYRATTGN